MPRFHYQMVKRDGVLPFDRERARHGVQLPRNVDGAETVTQPIINRLLLTHLGVKRLYGHAAKLSAK